MSLLSANNAGLTRFSAHSNHAKFAKDMTLIERDAHCSFEEYMRNNEDPNNPKLCHLSDKFAIVFCTQTDCGERAAAGDKRQRGGSLKKVTWVWMSQIRDHLQRADDLVPSSGVESLVSATCRALL